MSALGIDGSNTNNISSRPETNQDGVCSALTPASAEPSSMLHRSLHQSPLNVVSASGNYITVSTGQVIFDATGGAAVTCLGHGDPRVTAAVASQMGSVSYLHSGLYTSTGLEDFATAITDTTHGHMTKLMVLSSGSEAVEAAMKLCRQYFLELPTPQPNRVNFIARKQSYHGTTLGSLSLGGHVARRTLFEPMLLHNVSRVSACNAYRDQAAGEGTDDYVLRLAAELDAEFQRLGPDTVCAFVAETIVGAAMGCVPAVPGYFKAVQDVCRKYGALLFLDEIMCGMGRTGTMHAWEQEEVVPDVQTIGKGLGGGYAPISGVLVNKKVVEVLDKGTGSFQHGQTYQGHPVGCAVGLAVQRIIKQENLVQNVKKMGVLLGKLLREGLASHPNVGDIRGRGLFWGIEFLAAKPTKKSFLPSAIIAWRVQQFGLQPKYSIALYPGTGSADEGRSGDHILVAPAYNVSEADVREIASRTTDVIEGFFASMEFKSNEQAQ